MCSFGYSLGCQLLSIEICWRQCFENDFGEGELELSVIKISRVGWTALDCQIHPAKGNSYHTCPSASLRFYQCHSQLTCHLWLQLRIIWPPLCLPKSSMFSYRHQPYFYAIVYLTAVTSFSSHCHYPSFRSSNSCQAGGIAFWLALLFLLFLQSILCFWPDHSSWSSAVTILISESGCVLKRHPL